MTAAPRIDVASGPRVLTVASGKGGVGKTQISVNLAAALARKDCRVLLVDGDMGLANANLLLGLNPDYNVSHLLEGRRSLEEIVVSYDGLFDMMAAGSAMSSLAELDLGQQVRWVEGLRLHELAYDFVIIDGGAGIGSNVRLALSLASETMVVMNPETTSLTDAYALVKVAGRGAFGGRFQVVVNRVRWAEQARDIFECLDSTCRNFLGLHLELAGYIYRDDVVERALQSQRPFVESYPGSRASRCVDALASRLLGRQSNREMRTESCNTS
ncbi:MAG: AAA family ATPase [Myxococcota bacterium]